MKIPARTTKAGNEVPAFQVDDCFAEEVLKHSWIFNGKKNYNQYLKTAIKVDGKMQDEATVKQANVIIELAKKIRKKDPKLSKNFSKYLS